MASFSLSNIWIWYMKIMLRFSFFCQQHFSKWLSCRQNSVQSPPVFYFNAQRNYCSESHLAFQLSFQLQAQSRYIIKVCFQFWFSMKRFKPLFFHYMHIGKYVIMFLFSNQFIWLFHCSFHRYCFGESKIFITNTVILISS